MTFTGWPSTAIDFYVGLEADNSKAYWQAHKADYEAHVLGPMEQLLSELGAEFGEGKVFRPYRDTRFSKDKSPYKTAMGVSLGGGGYIQFSADGLGAGSGYYMMASDQLERFRSAIDDRGDELERLIAAATKKGIEVTAHDRLKTAPRGYAKDHPRVDLLRMKGPDRLAPLGP